MKKAYTDEEVNELIDSIIFYITDLKYSPIIGNTDVGLSREEEIANAKLDSACEVAERMKVNI